MRLVKDIEFPARLVRQRQIRLRAISHRDLDPDHATQAPTSGWASVSLGPIASDRLHMDLHGLVAAAIMHIGTKTYFRTNHRIDCSL